ncbi:MAG: hypothetical protein LQ352_003624 [Teloschistes flavicans]|nr:MAG: hypothetical protein LQ352_003624 [Teloschistes flavicans]
MLKSGFFDLALTNFTDPGDPGNDDGDDDDDDDDDDSTKETEKQKSTKPPESKQESTREPTSNHVSTTGPPSSSKPISSTSRSGTCKMPPEVTLPPDSSSNDDNGNQETSVVPSSISGESMPASNSALGTGTITSRPKSSGVSTSRSGTCKMPPEVTLPPDSSSSDDNSGQETSVVPSSLSGETLEGRISTLLSRASKSAGPITSYNPADCPNNPVQENAPYCPKPTKPTGFSCAAASNIGAATFNPETWCACGDHDYPTMDGDKPCAYSTPPSVDPIKPGPITPPPQPKTTDPAPTPTTYPPESVRLISLK